MGEAVSTKEKKPSFLKGVKAEFKKIIWPNKEETMKQSVAVLVVTIVVGVMIALLDMALQYGINLLV